MPRSIAPTSKLQRVRVEVFSNSSTTFLPRSQSCGWCACFMALSSAARSMRYSISAGVKSRSLRKLRPERLMPLAVAAASALVWSMVSPVPSRREGATGLLVAGTCNR